MEQGVGSWLEVELSSWDGFGGVGYAICPIFYAKQTSQALPFGGIDLQSKR